MIAIIVSSIVRHLYNSYDGGTMKPTVGVVRIGFFEQKNPFSRKLVVKVW